MKNDDGQRRYTAPALEKGLEILELLASEGYGLTQTEIARGLGRSANELYRMLAVLEQSRYIRRDGESGKYFLSLKLFELGRGIRLVEQLRAAAAGPMRAFSEEMEAECHLSLLEAGRLVVIYQTNGRGPIRIGIEPGSAHDPLCTASGRVILAHLDTDERERELHLAGQAFPPARKGRKAPLPDWDAIREAGVHWAEDESLVGLLDGAVAIRAGGHQRAALASTVFHTGLKERDRGRLGRRLKEIAEVVRTELGYL